MYHPNGFGEKIPPAELLVQFYFGFLYLITTLERNITIYILPTEHCTFQFYTEFYCENNLGTLMVNKWKWKMSLPFVGSNIFLIAQPRNQKRSLDDLNSVPTVKAETSPYQQWRALSWLIRWKTGYGKVDAFVRGLGVNFSECHGLRGNQTSPFQLKFSHTFH